jgi:hypothetical protein
MKKGGTTMLRNRSKTMTIEVTLGRTEPQEKDPDSPTKNTTIPPGGEASITRPFEGGCAKMLIWDASKPRSLIWCGIAPLSGGEVHPMIVDPEAKKVYHDDRELPECRDIEKFGDDGCLVSSVASTFSPIFWLVIAIAIVLAILLWRLRS